MSETGETQPRGAQRPPDRSGTVRKGLYLLELLGEYPDGATAAELVAASGYAFSTCYRLLATLVDSGFAQLRPHDKRYVVGLKAFALGQRAATARGFAGTALPIMREVTEATGESCLLAVRDGDKFLTVHTVDGPHHRTTTDPGDRGELHSSALGRALLAFAEPTERRKLVADLSFTPRTHRGVDSEHQLLIELDDTAHRGWARQDQEHDPGMCAIAVPVRVPDGPLLAALALAAPVYRCELDQLERQAPRLQEAADRLALQLPQRP